MTLQTLARTFDGRAKRALRLPRLTGDRVHVWLYALYVKLLRLDLGRVPLDELGLPADRSVLHDASGGPELAEVMAGVEIPPGSAIVDLGSGKGGAVLTLCRFPFDEVVGVEISERLVRTAEANARRAGARRVRFIVADAAGFTDLDRFTHVYMYHPFRAPVLEGVLENVRASLERRPRSLTLVYKNPVHHDTVMASGLFRQIGERQFAERSPGVGLFRIYRT